ncbi:MAG: DMT family transporter [Patescibacteria group bacterium]
MSKKQENVGVIFAFIAAAMAGMFPVLVNRGAQSIPPIMFAAITTLLAACGSFVYAILKGKLHELGNRKSYASLAMITLCIVVIPYTLFFVGASKTSGVNSSLLLLSEIIFTLLYTPFIGEETTINKLLGAMGVLIGASFILYNGKFGLNTGDLLVIVSTATFPIGNFYAKKALNFVSPAIILFIRFLIGGLLLLALSLVIEPHSNVLELVLVHWKLILFTGFILLGVGKVVWYEGLKRLDISKAISLVMTFPLFSLIFLVGFFNESLSFYQLVGIAIMAVGVFISIKRASVDAALTRYGT